MKVGLGQIDCVVGDVSGNVATMVAMIGDAAARGCEVVWFPELSDTGYGLSVMRDVAAAWPGEAFDALSGAAKQHGIAVGVGLSERDGETIFNSVAMFDAAGELAGTYRKVHLFCAGEKGGVSDEPACFAAGDAASSVQLGGLRHGLSICYDLRFPELYRKLVEGGAEVMVNATAWPNARPGHWDTLTRARAIENQAWFVGVGRVGEDGGIKLNGRSRVVSPMGDVVAEASGDRADLLVAEIEPAAIKEFRATVPALEHRRPQLWT